MQNNDEVPFTFLWKEVQASKLLVMLSLTVFGFILGLIISRPKKNKPTERNNYADTNHIDNHEYVNMEQPKKSGLSDEDREYIS